MSLSGGTDWREEEEDGCEDTGEGEWDCWACWALHNHNNPSQTSGLLVKERKGWLEYKYRLATDMLGMITSRCEGSGKKPSQSVRQCC